MRGARAAGPSTGAGRAGSGDPVEGRERRGPIAALHVGGGFLIPDVRIDGSNRNCLVEGIDGPVPLQQARVATAAEKPIAHSRVAVFRRGVENIEARLPL